jgi:hypothetical protein
MKLQKPRKRCIAPEQDVKPKRPVVLPVPAPPFITDAQIKAGWSESSLKNYLAERDKAVSGLIGGNQIVFMAPSRKRRLQVENTWPKFYDPHKTWRVP